MLTRQAELGCELPRRLATKVGMRSQQRFLHHRPLAAHNKLRVTRKRSENAVIACY